MNNKTKEFRENIANEFLKTLGEEPLTWKKNWKGNNIPFNGISKRPYNGINRFILQYIANKRESNDPRWFTFNQIRDKDLKLRKNSKGVTVEYYLLWNTEKKEYVSFEDYNKLGIAEKNKIAWRVRHYTVFNGVDVEGLEPYMAEMYSVEPSEALDILSKNMKVKIFNDGGDEAFYSPSSDTIHLPLAESFFSTYEYNATALHELAHSTGHVSRLNRDTVMKKTGQEEYAAEELVAELTSCYLSAELPINQDEEHLKNHKAYFLVWAKRIKENPEYLMKSLKEAEKAAQFMENALGLKKEKIKVAIESTEDYYDQTFCQELVDIDKEYNGAYGRIENKYRIVRMKENGYLVPYDDRIFKSYEEVKVAIGEDDSLEHISYDELVKEAEKKIREKKDENIKRRRKTR